MSVARPRRRRWSPASSTARSARSSRRASTTRSTCICQVLSYDGENEPDILALVAASAAMTISGVPFMGPIGAARVGYIDGEYILNPTDAQVAEGELDLVVAATHNAVMMVESEAKELSEEVMLGAVMFAHKASQQVINAIIDLAEKAAKDPWELKTGADNSTVKAELKKLVGKDIEKRLQAGRQVGPLERAQRGAREGQGRDGRQDPAGAARRRQARQEAGSRHRPHRHPQGRPPHRRPRHEDRPPDRGDRALPAARPRLGAVHARRDPDHRHLHLGHQGQRADDRWPDRPALRAFHAPLQLPALLGG